MSEINSLLTEVYNNNGIEFRYPDFWELIEEKSENELTININSPETSFWSLTLYYDGIDPEAVMKTALDAFESEYENLDQELADDTICQRKCLGYDLNFICHDLTNSVFLRTFRTAGFTVFLYYQATDDELDESHPLFKGICTSLKCEDDHLIFGN